MREKKIYHSAIGQRATSKEYIRGKRASDAMDRVELKKAVIPRTGASASNLLSPYHGCQFCKAMYFYTLLRLYSELKYVRSVREEEWCWPRARGAL